MTTAALHIIRSDYPNLGSYVATLPGVAGIARLNYRRERPDLLVAERVEISESLRPHGAGIALARRMVDDARAEGVKIYFMCPYLIAERRNHPEWEDVLV
ncbi:MAG TPA: GNAT family N-acetyltransferase [Burkholderiales bacterium]